MESLLLVSILAREEHASDKHNCDNEDDDRIDGEIPGRVDAELEDAPPVASLEDPEEDERGNDSSDVLAIVLIDPLVVTFVNGIVPLSITLLMGLESGF